MKKAFVQLHIAVLLAGLTGVLGRLITLNEGLLVWYRLLLTVAALWILAFFSKSSSRILGRDIARLFGIGAIAACHWVAFFGSIKYSNVSIGLLCFSAVGFFTALIEPLVMRHRIDVVELLLGLLAIAGIYLIFHADPQYKTGIVIGLISSLLGSLFPVLNKQMLDRVPTTAVTLYELTGGFLFLCILLPFYLRWAPTASLLPGLSDWIWLLVLSIACTVLAFNLSMNALKRLSAFTVNLSYNLEPIYGILLAFALFREDKFLHGNFYIGFALIFLSIGLQMLRMWKRRTV